MEYLKYLPYDILTYILGHYDFNMDCVCILDSMDNYANYWNVCELAMVGRFTCIPSNHGDFHYSIWNGF